MWRASLEELRLDYEDYLRQHGLPQWPREDARRANLIARRPATADDVAAWARSVHVHPVHPKSTKSTVPRYPEIAANGALALLAVACSLLDRQIKTLENNFVQQGGFTERLHRVRSQSRARG